MYAERIEPECGRCSACEPEQRFVPGDGLLPCHTLFIGEKPGQHEAAIGRPFIGDSGSEFNSHYLRLMGLSRSDIRITNTVHCRLGGNNNKPDEDQVLACASHHLPAEVRACQPRVVVLMGATACSLCPTIDLVRDHGLPRWVEAGGLTVVPEWSGWVVAMYHPASGMHDTAMMQPLMEDFKRAGEWLKGRWELPVDEWLGREDYREITTVEELQADFLGASGADWLPEYNWLPVDTENDGPRPWSLQYSLRPGHGRLIAAERLDLIELFDHFLGSLWEFEGAVMHNATHDIAELEQMGITEFKWRDTMQESFHLANLPQGLKALAWRVLGISMQSWEDLVTPPSLERMKEWLVEKWQDEAGRPVVEEKQLKTKVKRVEKPNEGERTARHLLRYIDSPTYKIWDKIQEMNEERGLGWAGWPIRSIANVERRAAVVYACKDADVTGRLAVWFEQERKKRVEKGGVWYVEK
jgi:uracil-DNA glycosylase family 4